MRKIEYEVHADGMTPRAITTQNGVIRAIEALQAAGHTGLRLGAFVVVGETPMPVLEPKPIKSGNISGFVESCSREAAAAVGRRACSLAASKLEEATGRAYSAGGPRARSTSNMNGFRGFA